MHWACALNSFRPPYSKKLEKMEADAVLQAISRNVVTVTRQLAQDSPDRRQLATILRSSITNLRRMSPSLSETTVSDIEDSLLELQRAVEEPRRDALAGSTADISSPDPGPRTRGRPSFKVDVEFVRRQLQRGYTARRIALQLGCSAGLVYRTLREEGLTVGSTKYSSIDDDELDQHVREIHCDHPNAGYVYLHLRFSSKSVRTLATLIGMLQTISYMGVTLYAPALALQTVAGIPLWLSIVVLGLIGTIYTSIGGIKSVVWTDVFQTIMIFIGLTAILIKGSLMMAKNNSVYQIAKKGKRLEFFNFDPDPRVRHSNWGLFIGLPFSFLANWCNQSSIQRISSLRSLQAAKGTLLMQIPLLAIYIVIVGYLGILLYSYYNVLECDPVRGGYLSSFNQLMPFFVLDVFRSLPGLSGIYISCLFSGALSSLSSGINALAANTVEDIIGDNLKKLKIISYTHAAKLFVLLYGLIVIGLAYGINYMSGNVMQITMIIFGAVGGPVSGLFFLGGLVYKANWIGALVGSISAIMFNIWIAVGAQMYGNKPVKLPPNPTSGCYYNISHIENILIGYNTSTVSSLDTVILGTTTKTDLDIRSDDGFFLYNLSYTWYGFIGFFLTLIIGTVVSYCTGHNHGGPVEARLIFPLCRKLWNIQSGTPSTDETIEQTIMISPGNIDNDNYQT